MRAVVVSGGDLAAVDLAALEGAGLVVAADGGAGALLAAGHTPGLLVGDLDSIDAKTVEALAARGMAVDRHPADKEASDTELAVERCLADGADEVTLIGALGGERLDHALANALLLTEPGFGDVRMVHGNARARALRAGGRLALDGAVGDLVSLLPLGGDATEVTTHGLRWPLAGEVLRVGRTRGLGNEIVALPASVELGAGVLLVVEMRR